MDPYTGEIRMWPCPKIPQGWHLCDGSALPLNTFQVLFALIGTTYGGDGKTTFNVPNLIGRVPVHQGQGPGLTNRVLGQTNGSTTVVLTEANIPNHSHPINGSTLQATSDTPDNTKVLAATTGTVFPYAKEDAVGQKAFTLDVNSLNSAGGNAPHSNAMPTLSLNFIICTNGIFPQPN